MLRNMGEKKIQTSATEMEEELLKGGHLENKPITKTHMNKLKGYKEKNKAESIITAHTCSFELCNSTVDDNNNNSDWQVV